jgi:hypothetical protein
MSSHRYIEDAARCRYMIIKMGCNLRGAVNEISALQGSRYIVPIF